MWAACKESHLNMELRQVLLPPKLDEMQIESATRLARQIVAHVDSGRDFSQLMTEFNVLAARSCAVEDLVGAASSMDMKDFAKFALTPKAPYRADLSRDEQLELIWRVGFSEYDSYEDYEINFWREMLHRNLGGAPLAFGTHTNPEEVLEKALAYKPIAL